MIDLYQLDGDTALLYASSDAEGCFDPAVELEPGEWEIVRGEHRTPLTITETITLHSIGVS